MKDPVEDETAVQAGVDASLRRAPGVSQVLLENKGARVPRADWARPGSRDLKERRESEDEEESSDLKEQWE